MFCKILILTLAMSLTYGQSVDICSSKACKCVEENERFHIECSGLIKSDTFNLENFLWPDTNLPITLTIRDMTINSVPRLTLNHNVESISLRGNNVRSITPTAFTGLTNLTTLILAENSLSYLTPDMFQGLKNLKNLDLSDNELTEISNMVFDELQLIELNLSGNNLMRIPKEVTSMSSLTHLNVSRNTIFSVTFEDTNLSQLISIDLSFNNFTVFTDASFIGSKSLQIINLCNNYIRNIEPKTFTQLVELRELYLGDNILGAPLALPLTLTHLCLARNQFNQWPLEVNLANLVYLNLDGNRLENLEIDDSFVNLETLIVSTNQLTKLPTVNFPALRELNLAKNLFAEVPANLNSELFPKLEHLILDGNPITDLDFKNTLHLNKLDANNLQFLKKINSLANIATTIEDTSAGSCVNISITNCENLEEIDEKTFIGLPLCKLDLSNNKLTFIPRNTLNWSDFPKYGVDLQGNPLNCNCNLQWILDDLLPLLYTKHPELLQNLKCETPEVIKGQRLVHWYNWDGKAMCENLSRMRMDDNAAEVMASADSNVELLMGSSTGFYVVVAMSIFTLVSLIAAAMYLVKQQKRKNLALRRNRRLQA